MNLSPDTVRNTFGLDGQDRHYKTLRDELLNWVQIRRERESGGLERLEGTKKSGIGSDDMDIGALIRRKQQELHNLEDQLWKTQECEQEWYSDQDVQETGDGESVDAVNLKGKGKGKGTGFEKLKGFGKGKGFSKGKGAKGKGKFQGECYNCGMWGHSARFCQEWKGKGNVPQTTFNTEVEEARPGAQQELSELGFTRPRHVIGYVEITKPVHFETKNNFQELADDEEGNEDSSTFYWESHLEMQQQDEKNNVYRRQNYHGEKKGRKMSNDELMEVHSYIQGGTSDVGGKVPSWKQISNVTLEEKDSEENLVINKNDLPELRHAEPSPRKKKKLVFPRTKGSMKKLELNHCGVQQVEIQGVSKSRRKMMITVDSGAAESVTSEQNFSEIPTRPSARTRGGVEYVNANGGHNAQSRGKVGAREDQRGRLLRTETPGD